MSVGTFLLAVIVLAIAAVVVIAAWMSRASRPKETRREMQLDALVDELRELAFEYRDVDRGRAEAVIDRIRTYRNTEK